ncbi:MAG: MFS transporter [Chloroflexi bacterium OHK40]
MRSEPLATGESSPVLAPPQPLWRNRAYALIIAAGTISTIGSAIGRFALPLLALALTDSALWAALLGSAQLLPYLLFSLPAGAWVDRAPRRHLLVGCHLARFLLIGSIPLAFALGQLTMPHLLAAVFLAGLCTLLFEIADMAALPHLVQPAQLARARSVSEGVEATAEVVGPSLGGLIVGAGSTVAGGAALALLSDSLSSLVSAGALPGVRRPLQGPPAPPAPLRAVLLQGLRFVWGHGPLRAIMLLTAAVNFLQAPISLLVILTAQEHLALSPAHIGLLFGVAGIAGVLGAAIAGWWYQPERLRLTLLGSLALWALSAAVMAIAPTALALGFGLALTRLMWPIYGVAVVAYRLEATPAALQGRVISAFRALSYGAEPLGLALGGIAVTVLSPPLLFGMIAVGLLGCGGFAVGRRL